MSLLDSRFYWLYAVGWNFLRCRTKGEYARKETKEFPCILFRNTQIVISENLWKAAGREYSEIAVSAVLGAFRIPLTFAA